MTTMVSGSVGPENRETNQNIRDVASRIFLLDSSAAPFTALLSQLRKKSSKNSKIEWYSDVLNPEWDAINNVAGEAAAQTTLTVDNGAYFNPYDLVKVPRTGEVFLVTSIDTNDLTAVRGYGTTSAADMNDNEPLLILGPAYEDGKTASTSITTQAVNGYNYLQEFKRSIELTRRAINTDSYGQHDMNYLRRKKAIEVAKEIEKAMLFGERRDDSGTKDTNLSHHRYCTGGLLSFITTNTWNVAGTLAESDFDDHLGETVFAHGNSTKYALFSSRLISIIDGWGKSKLILEPDDQVYGIKIHTYRSSHGDLKIIYERHLSGATYNGYGIILDLKDGDVAYRYLQNCDLKWDYGIQANDKRTKLDEVSGIIGLQVGNEALHDVIYGVTGAA